MDESQSPPKVNRYNSAERVTSVIQQEKTIFILLISYSIKCSIIIATFFYQSFQLYGLVCVEFDYEYFTKL